MEFDSWRAFYESDLQGLYALLVAPSIFLIHLLLRRSGARVADPRDRFVRAYLLIFTLEMLLDPIAVTAAGSVGGGVATAAGLLFVLLGDFRVYLLYFHLGGLALWPAIGAAVAATPVVAVSALALERIASDLAGPLPGQVLWLTHELLFTALALVLRARTRDGFLRGALAYVVAYYALWAAADVLALAGIDAGWLLRCLPNQLYYAFWTPFVHALWRGGRASR